VKLKVLLPTGVLADTEAEKVSFEAADGARTLLERHVDLATALVPGVLIWETGGQEQLAAVAEGTLVKVGEEVLVSVRRGVRGERLGDLRDKVEEDFRRHSEREEQARASLTKLEATLVHRFMELDHG
jgi:F-type H+-transporting ATPase subunit epsilon